MTRYLVAKEGVETIIPNFFEIGSFKWDDGPVTITWENEWEVESILGVATEFKREDDNTITAEIEWTTTKGKFVQEMVNNDVFLTVFCTEANYEEVGGINKVSTATIKGLFTTVNDPWQEKTPPGEIPGAIVWKAQG